jgi:hypothetical protein
MHGGRDLNTSKAQEIVSYVSQSRAYLSAASSADIIVRPLLQYYSVLALSRGTILLGTPNLRETALAKSHGLSAVGWEETLNGKAINWLQARIRTDGGGTFSQLLSDQALRSNARIWLYDERPRRYPTAVDGELPSGFELRVIDVLSRLPVLRALVSEVAGFESRSWDCRTDGRDDHVGLTIYPNSRGLPTEGDLRRWLELDASDKISYEDVLLAGEGPTKLLHIDISLVGFESPYRKLRCLSGDRDLIAPLEGGYSVSLTVLTYIASYALGMFVRYYPEAWMSVVGRLRGDALLPIVSALTGAIDGYPHLLLEAFM